MMAQKLLKTKIVVEEDILNEIEKKFLLEKLECLKIR